MEAEFGKPQQQLAEAEQKAVLAATSGKQLLEKTLQLDAEMEALEQEKHCLSSQPEASEMMEQSLVTEIEQPRENQSSELKAKEAQATQSHDQDLQKDTKKILELESFIRSRLLRVANNHERAKLLEARLREAQERLDDFSNLDQSVDNSISLLKTQIDTAIQEKQDLEKLFHVIIKTSKYWLEQARKRVMPLETVQELQVASLPSPSDNRASREYESHIEEPLPSARAQLETLANHCKQLEEAQ